jgi:hypothetical protein
MDFLSHAAVSGKCHAPTALTIANFPATSFWKAAIKQSLDGSDQMPSHKGLIENECVAELARQSVSPSDWAVSSYYCERNISGSQHPQYFGRQISLNRTVDNCSVDHGRPYELYCFLKSRGRPHHFAACSSQHLGFSPSDYAFLFDDEDTGSFEALPDIRSFEKIDVQ